MAPTLTFSAEQIVSAARAPHLSEPLRRPLTSLPQGDLLPTMFAISDIVTEIKNILTVVPSLRDAPSPTSLDGLLACAAPGGRLPAALQALQTITNLFIPDKLGAPSALLRQAIAAQALAARPLRGPSGPSAPPAPAGTTLRCVTFSRTVIDLLAEIDRAEHALRSIDGYTMDVEAGLGRLTAARTAATAALGTARDAFPMAFQAEYTMFATFCSDVVGIGGELPALECENVHRWEAFAAGVAGAQGRTHREIKNVKFVSDVYDDLVHTLTVDRVTQHDTLAAAAVAAAADVSNASIALTQLKNSVAPAPAAAAPAVVHAGYAGDDHSDGSEAPPERLLPAPTVMAGVGGSTSSPPTPTIAPPMPPGAPACDADDELSSEEPGLPLPTPRAPVPAPGTSDSSDDDSSNEDYVTGTGTGTGSGSGFVSPQTTEGGLDPETAAKLAAAEDEYHCMVARQSLADDALSTFDAETHALVENYSAVSGGTIQQLLAELNTKLQDVLVELSKYAAYTQHRLRCLYSLRRSSHRLLAITELLGGAEEAIAPRTCLSSVELVRRLLLADEHQFNPGSTLSLRRQLEQLRADTTPFTYIETMEEYHVPASSTDIKQSPGRAAYTADIINDDSIIYEYNSDSDGEGEASPRYIPNTAASVVAAASVVVETPVHIEQSSTNSIKSAICSSLMTLLDAAVARCHPDISPMPPVRISTNPLPTPNTLSHTRYLRLAPPAIAALETTTAAALASGAPAPKVGELLLLWTRARMWLPAAGGAADEMPDTTTWMPTGWTAAEWHHCMPLVALLAREGRLAVPWSTVRGMVPAVGKVPLRIRRTLAHFVVDSVTTLDMPKSEIKAFTLAVMALAMSKVYSSDRALIIAPIKQLFTILTNARAANATRNSVHAAAEMHGALDKTCGRVYSSSRTAAADAVRAIRAATALAAPSVVVHDAAPMHAGASKYERELVAAAGAPVLAAQLAVFTYNGADTLATEAAEAAATGDTTAAAIADAAATAAAQTPPATAGMRGCVSLVADPATPGAIDMPETMLRPAAPPPTAPELEAVAAEVLAGRSACVSPAEVRRAVVQLGQIWHGAGGQDRLVRTLTQLLPGMQDEWAATAARAMALGRKHNATVSSLMPFSVADFPAIARLDTPGDDEVVAPPTPDTVATVCELARRHVLARIHDAKRSEKHAIALDAVLTALWTVVDAGEAELELARSALASGHYNDARYLSDMCAHRLDVFARQAAEAVCVSGLFTRSPDTHVQDDIDMLVEALHTPTADLREAAASVNAEAVKALAAGAPGAPGMRNDVISQVDTDVVAAKRLDTARILANAIEASIRRSLVADRVRGDHETLRVLSQAVPRSGLAQYTSYRTAFDDAKQISEDYAHIDEATEPPEPSASLAQTLALVGKAAVAASQLNIAEFDAHKATIDEDDVTTARATAKAVQLEDATPEGLNESEDLRSVWGAFALCLQRGLAGVTASDEVSPTCEVLAEAMGAARPQIDSLFRDAYIAPPGNDMGIDISADDMEQIRVRHVALVDNARARIEKLHGLTSALNIERESSRTLQGLAETTRDLADRLDAEAATAAALVSTGGEELTAGTALNLREIYAAAAATRSADLLAQLLEN